MLHMTPILRKSLTYSSTAPAPPSGSGASPSSTSNGASGSAPVPAPSSAAPAPSSAPAAPVPSSPAEQSWGGWQPSRTWDSQPWQSGNWREHDAGNGAYAVGVPVQRQHDTGVEAYAVGVPTEQGRRHRHLRQHKAHKAGRL